MIKNQGQQYSHLAPRELGLGLWHTISVDLIRPCTATVNKQELEFKVLTIMDTATNFLEIVQIDNRTSRNITQMLTNNWLAQYPWPAQILHDNGGEFIGHKFQDMMRTLGITITAKPTTVKNPQQANAIIEQLHKTMADVLRVMLYHNQKKIYAYITKSRNTMPNSSRVISCSRRFFVAI